LIKLTLYSRSYCHLCDDMLAALNTLRDEFSFDVSVIDVDQDASLIALYDELVPVLVGDREGQLVQLCHYFLEVDKVRLFLKGRITPTSPGSR